MSLTTPTVTGWSGFWANIISPNQPQGGTYAFQTGQARAKMAYHVARLFNKRGMGDARGALAALIGAAAGGAADVHWTRRVAPAGPTDFGDFGGNITLETVYNINRVTTAADVTELKKWFAQALLEAGITYPTTVGNSLSSGMQVGGTGRF